ncbi:hypothetical protein EV144_103489 [Flavobacterium sp. 270]|nr:hypothetical protein EV144_103489 [Flavobacterium sp. 270]
MFFKSYSFSVAAENDFAMKEVVASESFCFYLVIIFFDL